MIARIVLAALAPVLLVPGAAPAQQLRTLVVPEEAEVAIAARGAPQPRLAPRPAPVATGSAPEGRASSRLFESDDDDEMTLGTAGQVALPLAAAAALAAVLGSGLGGRGGGGPTAPARTR